MEPQPTLPIRSLHNYIYCPRLFYYQWVENIFQENADTVEGSHVHRGVDQPSRLEDLKELKDFDLPEGSKVRSLRLESEKLGIVGVVDVVEGGPEGGINCGWLKLDQNFPISCIMKKIRCCLLLWEAKRRTPV